VDVNRRIKYYRKKKGLSQEDMATALGIQSTNYAKYESGARNPKPDKLAQIAEKLGVSVTYLIEGEENIVVEVLNRHVRSSIAGNVFKFNEFVNDITAHDNVYRMITANLVHWDNMLKEDYSEFHAEFLKEPSISSLLELNKRYRKANEWFKAQPKERRYVKRKAELESGGEVNENDVSLYKIAFYVAAEKFIDTRKDGSFNPSVIFSNVREHLGNEDMDDSEALIFFAAYVFVPFLTHILDALETFEGNNLTDNSFSFAFLRDGLGPLELLVLASIPAVLRVELDPSEEEWSDD